MPIKVFGDSISGNCHKVRYVCDLLSVDYEWHEVNILQQESRTPEYLQINPQGQVPAIQLPGGETIAQSNAIMRYLAHGSFLLPTEPLAQARVDEWLFWEQYSHEPYIAVNRFQMLYLGKTADELEAWRVERGYAALDYMDGQLADRQWLANDSFSIADIALYAYTSMATQGGFDLARYHELQRWLTDCKAALKTG
jgi:glutathione S-transferase